METTKDKNQIHTQITDRDRRVLGRLIETLKPLVTLEPIGRYASMSADEIWMTLVIQICVMGSARHIERLADDTKKYKEFEKAISISVVANQQNQPTYLSEILRQFSATRFHKKSADRLSRILTSPNIFLNGQIFLLKGLSHENDTIHMRDELIERCPIFGLKSASDFMISIGLSHNVIALDTRVVGVFQKYFDYNLTPGQVQSKRNVYFSLESALRKFCQQKQVSLAFLDRLLFNYSNLSVIELVVKYPELLR